MRAWRFGVVVALACFAGMAARANDSFWRCLTRPNSLVGWTHGTPNPAGWTVDEFGAFIAAPGASPLLSAWTFGDFELAFDFAANDGTLTLQFPDVPEGSGLQLALSAGEHCGQLTDNGKPVAAGVALQASRFARSAAVRRAGEVFSFSIDGKPVFDVKIAAKRRLGLGLAAQGAVKIANLRVCEPVGESIFDGKSLAGWWCPGDLAGWGIRDGSIARVGGNGKYVCTEKTYANFTFSCECKPGKGTNSGIAIRTPRLGWPSADGMEMQVWDVPIPAELDKHQYMAIYGNVPPLARADCPSQWNKIVIQAEGYMISAWVNGELVQQINTFDLPELKWRNLRGWIGFQDHNGYIEFRDIHVLESPEGLGLKAWYAPRPAQATTIVGRLMNSERLSVADGVSARTVSVCLGQPKRDWKPTMPEESKKKGDGKKGKKDDKAKKPDAKDNKRSDSKDGKKSDAKEKDVKKPELKNEKKPDAKENKKPEPQEAKKADVKKPQPQDVKTPDSKKPEPKDNKKPEPKKAQAKDVKKPEPKVVKKPEPPPVKPADFTLAELKGPGAVVRIARTSNDGTLAFYFDGEAKPRLECKPADLYRAGPELAEDNNPVITCLPYQKSLKIMLKQAAGAEYRFDVVDFPASLPVKTFTHGAEQFPRAWLPPIIYRLGQHGTSTHREYDPLPRPGVSKKSVAPGKTESMLELPGAGIVHWVKFQCPRSALENNDLWLEATVDGESTPAVSAPARFWFAPLASSGNHRNYVMVDRGGFTLRLAMPFSKGIRFAVKNCGKKQIDDLGLSVSLESATDANRAEIASRMRLRGVFTPATVAGDLASLKGPGRWIGLVCQPADRKMDGADMKPFGIDSVVVDGQSRPECKSPDFDAFLGYLPGEARRVASGRSGKLAWRFLLLDSVDFQKSLVVKPSSAQPVDRLIWCYAK